MQSSESAGGGQETILLVEDDGMVRKLATRVLEKLGYTILSAEDGILALEIERAHPGEIKLLLSDVVMPRMTGQALAERLLRTRPMLKVLYVSGYTDNPVVRQSALDPRVAFLAKPYTPLALARKVRNVLDSE